MTFAERRVEARAGSEAVSEHQCNDCRSSLREPFIKCAECTDCHLCLACFAAGSQAPGSGHSNSHRYKVIRDDFCLFEDWTARDELALVGRVEELGPSFWTEVAKHLNRSSSACESHYLRNYVEYPVGALPRPTSPEQLYRPLPVTFKTGINDPPRPVPGTGYHRDLAGYCAARGDFQTEIFQHAELDVAAISEWPDADDQDDDEASLEEALTAAVVQVYNDKLRERCRRKRVVQEHGLVHIHRHLAARFKYDATLTRRVCERLSAFAQLLRFDEFATLFESLHCHAELGQKIRTLQKYRHIGIRSFQAAQLYAQLKMRREKHLKALKQFNANLNTQQLPLQQQQQQQQQQHQAIGCMDASVSCPVVNLSAMSSLPARRSAPPLDIVGLPGYDKLNGGEKQLCSVSRLVPESYLEFRNILINECRARSGIRLAQARTLIKIDVNKTRKIFDFLVDEKLIYLPS